MLFKPFQGAAAGSGFTESFDSGEIALSANLNTSASHLLSGTPTLARAVLRCKTSEFGYAIDDEIMDFYAVAGTVGNNLWVNSTSIGFKMGATIQISNRSSNADASITLASWKLILRCWK